MKTIGKITLTTFALMASWIAEAQLTLPTVFSDNMVLQQKSDVPVWGWGGAAQTLKVVGSWAPGDTTEVKVGSDGTWMTKLKTIEAGGPYTLKVIGGSETKEFDNVMLGEVWLCSGQSNMEWTAANNLVNKEAEIAAANYPNIRIFHLPHRGADYPQSDCYAEWTRCTPETMQHTSAIAYFFARRLQQEMGVPVGIIVAAWGGTPIEVWIKGALVENDPVLKAAAPTYEIEWMPTKAGSLYNQMINPVIPYSISGALWYQGEANHPKYDTYGLAMRTMIEGWRSDFGKNFPFYFVQIAPFEYHAQGNTPALLREQQEIVTKLVPNTGMVVVSDLVADVKDIHPIDKQNVGLRLANMALAEVYGQPLENYKSPTFKSLTVEKGKAIISFDNAECGLTCPDKKIEGLKIAGKNGEYVDAEGTIKGDKLIVSSPEIKEPVSVTFCFDDATEGNLFSKAGLPVAPFRSDRVITFFPKNVK